jgi:hypothetical protein
VPLNRQREAVADVGWDGGVPRVPQAARIIAQMIVMGSGVFLKAASAAYRKAIVSTRPTRHPLSLGFGVSRPRAEKRAVSDGRRLLKRTKNDSLLAYPINASSAP